MNEKMQLALIVAYYLSKHDAKAYKQLGFGNQSRTHEKIGRVLSVNPNTIKNMRDEYDSIHENPRKGWYQEELKPSRKKISNQLAPLKEDQLLELVRDILSGESVDEFPLTPTEKKEIGTKEKEIIEGELRERKVMAYSRNAKATRTCKERDNYQCQSCGFKLGEGIVECHHLKPLHVKKAATVKLEELITLCPTCHRIAHSLLRTDLLRYSSKTLLVRELQRLQRIQ